ncbi:minor capsid protein [Capnocytophaga sp.]|uniref:phage head morphogenesis protein n=1 Tax=Capnocytophaga sp. TaxID=44737 RepID=UPI0026DC8DB2|nr:minor capsid protein [Capnocytophaga sp.]MDO5106127.1 minor capsid protein [Capnocytophaga sp.]
MGAFFGFFRRGSSVEVTLFEELNWEELEREYQSCCEVHSAHLSAGDGSWADELARLWISMLEYIYKTKKVPDELINRDIVALQAHTLMRPIERIFQGVEFDSPDYVLREILKQNMWDFSVAKNYNDVVAINNLLLKENGSFRPWHDFKHEAQKVVGRSIRYLKTEHNTVVAGAQMSGKWQEIQRDKHLFPFVQFKVIVDGHTSDVCKPLHDVIVSVDDPMLMYYFPPNHFNCRTTVMRLRRATPTAKYDLPKIPEAFKNNPAISGKIFTDKHKYFLNTPQEVMKFADVLQKADLLSKPRSEQFKKLFETENGGQVLEHLLLRKGKDYESILASAKEFAKQGKIAEILPELNQKELKKFRDVVFPNYDLNKNPDLRVNGIYHDVKEVEQLYNFIKNANRAAKQGAIPIIRFDGISDFNLIQKQVVSIFNDKNYPYNVVYLLHKGKLYRYNKG